MSETRTSYLTIKEARELFPQRPSVETMRRWCKLGFRGHKLWSKRYGHAYMTTREACEQFIDAINTPEDSTV